MLDWLPWLGLFCGVVLSSLAVYVLIKADAIRRLLGLEGDEIQGVRSIRIFAGLVLSLILLLVISWPLSGSTSGVEFVALFGAMATLLFVIPFYARFLKTRAAAEKVCPECQKHVKTGAHTCRHCGYRFLT